MFACFCYILLLVIQYFVAKGKACEEGLRIIDDIDNLDVILLTVPFFYSNFVGFFTPLPINNNNNIIEQKNNITEWQLNACFGDGSTNQIDMMSTNDLSIIVRKYLCVI